MANILYGVNGEGAGHSTRSKEVIYHLIEQGNTVHVASFDRGLANLSKSFDVTEIFGLRFAYVNNQVRYRRTAAKNLLAAPKAARSFARLLRLTDDWKIDLVITDFEPLTARIGHHRRIPIISIDNQHCLTHTNVKLPRQHRRDAAAAKITTRLMTPHAQAYFVTSFFPARPTRKGTFLVPPILRREVLEVKPSSGNHVLVYVTSPSPELASMLRHVRCEFVAYGFGREGRDGNIDYKMPSMEGFLADLASCKGIAANAGFSLVSEALHLGKPYLAIPVKHQFEQIFNAYFLAQQGYGAFWEELSREKIESFLFNLPHYAEALAAYARQDNSALLAKLDQTIREWAGRSTQRRSLLRRREASQ
ncbi:MAG TPA: glycosyltransferase family protein [Candidatus Limnocylindrales bacterium]|jgi:uncharacterized protein (TIGR00661 family)|nr:glycosyltransferase family protein [Candidatus Limnocylindrales bacterium]